MPAKHSFWLSAGLLSSATLTPVLGRPDARVNLARAAANATTIQWGPCKTVNNVSVPFSCGVVTVPLDYTDSSNTKTLDIPVVKYPAAKQPPKASILMNPGGPGDGGRNFLYTEYPVLQAVLGTDYDMISWDPRASGATLPFHCYADNSTAQLGFFYAQTLGFSETVNGYKGELGFDWAVQGSLATACAENAADVGELIGTAFAARDMMEIVDALGEDGLLRYWGFSYGTILGATAAAMFPERVDKVVLDGVVNPTQYYAGRDIQATFDTDAVVAGFVTGCVAAPNLCPLARFETAEVSLFTRLKDLLESSKLNPIVFGSDLTTGLVSYGYLKNLIFGAMYMPLASWQRLSIILDGVLSRNQTTYERGLAFGSGGAAPFESFQPLTGEQVPGIRCSDVSLRTDNLTSLKPLIKKILQTGEFGSDIDAWALDMTCPQWPFKAKEVYTGGFNNITTRRPILFVGNTFDPITSLAGARNASAGFVGSRVLVNNGYGHTSFGQQSICVAENLRAFFSDGTLPPENTVCQPTTPPFTNITAVEALAPLNRNSTA